MLDVDPETISPEQRKRAKEYLSKYDLRLMNEQNQRAGIYHTSMGKIFNLEF